MAESYILEPNIWSSFVLLLRQKNQKHLSSAKLVKYLLLINKIAETLLFKVVLPRTVADDVSAYRITL